MITLGIDSTEGRRPRRRQSTFVVVLRMCEQIAMFMEEHEAQDSKGVHLA